MRDIALIIIAPLLVYLLASLVTYSPQDPGWSQSGSVTAPLHNLGGKVGAFLADVLLYLTGYVAFLLPLILVLSAVGAYSINNNPVDVYWMLGFGLFGYFLKMYGFQVGPVILGMILGPIMDRSYRQAMLSTGEDVGLFFTEFFTTPLSALILAALAFTIVSQTSWYKKLRNR